MVVLPYMKGTTETIQRILKSYHIGSSVKPHTTLRKLLVHPKDKIVSHKNSEIVYEIPCKNCNQSYIGEMGRTLGQRVKEHRAEADKTLNMAYTRSNRRESEKEVNKSAITDHARQHDHVIDWEGAQPLDRESDKYKRWIREAVWIRKKSPTMNRDKGAYQLSQVWTVLLTTTPPSGQ